MRLPTISPCHERSRRATAPSDQHTPLSYRLAEFFVCLKADDLPRSVVDDARWRLVDTIGVAFAGSRMDYAQAVKDVAIEMGGPIQVSSGSGTACRPLWPATHQRGCGRRGTRRR